MRWGTQWNNNLDLIGPRFLQPLNPCMPTPEAISLQNAPKHGKSVVLQSIEDCALAGLSQPQAFAVRRFWTKSANFYQPRASPAGSSNQYPGVGHHGVFLKARSDVVVFGDGAERCSCGHVLGWALAVVQFSRLLQFVKTALSSQKSQARFLILGVIVCFTIDIFWHTLITTRVARWST